MLQDVLNERTRRLWPAPEADAIGFGGISRMVEATGSSWTTVVKRIDELAEQRDTCTVLSADRIRRPGRGDKHLREKDPTPLSGLAALVEPATRGD
jgi:hypothetical protein